jgi:hypothetical protein
VIDSNGRVFLRSTSKSNFKFEWSSSNYKPQEKGTPIGFKKIRSSAEDEYQFLIFD